MVDPISPQKVSKSSQTGKERKSQIGCALAVCQLFSTLCGEIGSTILLSGVLHAVIFVQIIILS